MVQWPIAPPPQQSLSLPDLVDSGYLFIILVNFDMAVEMQSAFGLQIWGVVDRHLPPVPKEDRCHTLTDMAIFRPRTDIYARRSLLAAWVSSISRGRCHLEMFMFHHLLPTFCFIARTLWDVSNRFPISTFLGFRILQTLGFSWE